MESFCSLWNAYQLPMSSSNLPVNCVHKIYRFHHLTHLVIVYVLQKYHTLTITFVQWQSHSSKTMRKLVFVADSYQYIMNSRSTMSTSWFSRSTMNTLWFCRSTMSTLWFCRSTMNTLWFSRTTMSTLWHFRLATNTMRPNNMPYRKECYQQTSMVIMTMAKIFLDATPFNKL